MLHTSALALLAFHLSSIQKYGGLASWVFGWMHWIGIRDLGLGRQHWAVKLYMTS